MELTLQQKAVLDKNGLFVVKACPGSGKTLVVAARFAKLLSDWRKPHQGIAVISFTNTAWREVESTLQKEYRIQMPIKYPHFLGTIDSFISKYLFLPFGHHVMKCDSRPEMKGPPHDNDEPIGRWLWWGKGNAECNQKGCRLNDFSYDENGTLINLAPISHFSNCTLNHSVCACLKNKFNKMGYATQADANYYALKLLQTNASLAKALAIRFPEVMVDEAQDTSRIQMTIIDLLVANGLQELMLVGDPDQAIFEWRNAEPALLTAKYNTWQSNSLILTENWRSSQNICTFASKISSLSIPMQAANPAVKSHQAVPKFVAYTTPSELPTLMTDFCNDCDNDGIPANSITVLTRSAEFLNALVPFTVEKHLPALPWKGDDQISHVIARAKYLYDHGAYAEALRSLEWAAFRLHTGKSHIDFETRNQIIAVKGLPRWRAELFDYLVSLPDTATTLGDWATKSMASRPTTGMFSQQQFVIKRSSPQRNYAILPFDDIFAAPQPVNNQSRFLGTVHSAKGTTCDAVFLAVKSKAARSGSYATILQAGINSSEELRIVYVAITRPRKRLCIAVPQSDLATWQQRFS